MASSWAHWPSAGPPPYFRDLREYETNVERMISTGVMLDEGMVYWYARPSARYPTVEVRVGDVCATTDDTVLVAALVRALVDTALDAIETGREAPRVPAGLLSAALWRAGFANQPHSVARDDGLRLSDCYITAAVRCAPPANRPRPTERDNCLPYLVRELVLLGSVRVIVCLGSFAWDVALRALAARGEDRLRPRPRFGHGATVPLGDLHLLGCYHPSQQNTFTGKLTESMLDEVFARARELVG